MPLFSFCVQKQVDLFSAVYLKGFLSAEVPKIEAYNIA